MEELVVKKDFSDVYTKKFPAPYLEQMRDVEYRIPDQTKPLYEHITERMINYSRKPINILDLGSSYGINSALLGHELVMSELDEFFIKQHPHPSLSEVHDFFSDLPSNNPNLRFYLVDTSSPALEFAENAGLCEKSFCVNLENEPLSKEFKQTLHNIDLIISTGCIGYIGWKSFERIFENISPNDAFPLFAFSLLRMFDVSEIALAFKRNNFVLVKTKVGPLKQRRFYDGAEMKKTLDLLKYRDLDTRGLEDTGYYYADFYMAGPAKNSSIWSSWVDNLESIFAPIQGPRQILHIRNPKHPAQANRKTHNIVTNRF